MLGSGVRLQPSVLAWCDIPFPEHQADSTVVDHISASLIPSLPQASLKLSR